jgi:hypothetical protein
MRSTEFDLDWKGTPYEVTCSEAPTYDPLNMFSYNTVTDVPTSKPLTLNFSFSTRGRKQSSLLSQFSSKIPALFGCTFTGGTIEYTKRHRVNCSFAFVPLNNELTPEQQQTLQTVIDKYQPAFSSGPSDIGNINSPHHVQHTIRVKEGAAPVCTNRPMTSFSMREKEFIESQVKLLLEL